MDIVFVLCSFPFSQFFLCECCWIKTFSSSACSVVWRSRNDQLVLWLVGLLGRSQHTKSDHGTKAEPALVPNFRVKLLLHVVYNLVKVGLHLILLRLIRFLSRFQLNLKAIIFTLKSLFIFNSLIPHTDFCDIFQVSLNFNTVTLG